ncbi:MAG: AIR synthase-related protein, partial [Clostridiales bacterium]|nr:AIR synthase-related protein [Clostridiales bacterium]
IGIPSSGLHSNGFSLTRKIVFDTAGLKLSDYVPEWGKTVAEELLTPTRIYVRLVLDLLEKNRAGTGAVIKGMSHITGGGLLENPNRMLPQGLDLELDWGAWAVPPVFDWLRERGGVHAMEMLRTYNMGIGFCLCTTADQADKLIADLAAAGEKSQVIGEVVSAKGAGGRVRVG